MRGNERNIDWPLAIAIAKGRALCGGLLLTHDAPGDDMSIMKGTRIAAALSAAWIAGAALYATYADIRVAGFLRNAAFEVCDYAGYRLPYANCWRDLMGVAAFLDAPWANLALIVFAPLLTAWLALRCWRWMRRAG